MDGVRMPGAHATGSAWRVGWQSAPLRAVVRVSRRSADADGEAWSQQMWWGGVPEGIPSTARTNENGPDAENYQCFRAISEDGE